MNEALPHISASQPDGRFVESRVALVLLWAVFLLPRAAAVLIPVVPSSDAEWYYTRAISLAEGHGYLSNAGAPTAYWPPGWSLVLSQVFHLLGASPHSVGLFNLLCAALAGWLLLDLARRISGSEVAGRAGLLLYALYPNAIGYVPLALTEVFYTTLLLAVCWLLVVPKGKWALVAGGLLLGLATLVKAQTLVVVPLILGIGLLREPGLWPNFWRLLLGAVARIMLLMALAAVVVAPWSLRNQRELGAFVAVSTNGGITLLTGNNDSARGDFTPDDPVVKALDARGLGELAHDAEARRLGVEWIAGHPAGFLKLMPLKLFRLWGPDGEAQWNYETGYTHYADWAGLFRALRIANQLYYFALLLGFAAAFAVLLRQRLRAGERWIGWWLLPYGIAAYPSLIAMVFSGQSRFHYPAMPFVCMACGWLLAAWLAGRRMQESSESA